MRFGRTRGLLVHWMVGPIAARHFVYHLNVQIFAIAICMCVCVCGHVPDNALDAYFLVTRGANRRLVVSNLYAILFDIVVFVQPVI